MPRFGIIFAFIIYISVPGTCGWDVFSFSQLSKFMFNFARPSSSSTFDLAKYNTLHNIYTYLEELENTYPNLVHVEDVGKTHEGRVIKLVKISSGNSQVPKPVIWVDGGMHAREWISISTAVYIIHSLVHKRELEPAITGMLKWFDWYIMPVVNPDGYEYSWKKDRLWRKNRSTGFSKRCPGVDLNRNFDINFGNAAETFLNPCDEKFPGPFPFSEPETAAIKNITENTIGPRLRAFISLHSFDQLWMFPDFQKNSECSRRIEILRHIEAVAKAATVGAGNIAGTKYSYGSIQSFVGDVGGSSLDWVFHRLGIIHSFAVELPDKGEFGFNLPENRILQTGEEMLSALAITAAKIVQLPPIFANYTACLIYENKIHNLHRLTSSYKAVIDNIRQSLAVHSN